MAPRCSNSAPDAGVSFRSKTLEERPRDGETVPRTADAILVQGARPHPLLSRWLRSRNSGDDPMTIDVTAGDLSLARERCEKLAPQMPGVKNIQTHLWHNPIAIALERIYGGRAAVTDERVFVSGPTFTCACLLTELGKAYLKDWRAGTAKANHSLFVAVSA